MGSQSVLVRAPATVGNFVGAVNCAALALDASLNMKVTPRLDGHVGVRYFGENGERVPRDRSNLAVRALQAALHLKQREFTGADFEIYSSIPVAVGLGSSTAAVLAGLIAADRLFRLALDEKTLFDLAAIYETRADNLRAAWLGGFVACGEEGSSAAHRRTDVPGNFVLTVVIPEASLGAATRADQNSWPIPPLARQDVSIYSRQATAFAEFFLRQGNAPAAEFAAPSPPTCEKNVPGLKEALAIRRSDVLAIFVCGSGPAVGILAQADPAQAVEAVRECFARHEVGSRAVEFRPTNVGARDWNASHLDITLPAARGLSASLRKPTLIPV